MHYKMVQVRFNSKKVELIVDIHGCITNCFSMGIREMYFFMVFWGTSVWCVRTLLSTF
jgi:hypothetical protein